MVQQPAIAESLMTGKDSRKRPQYDRRVLVLSSPHVPDPIHFRYAWGRNPMGNLQLRATDKKDIPFATQRSDDWKATPAVGRAAQDLQRERSKQIDLNRRLKDAQSLIDAHK